MTSNSTILIPLLLVIASLLVIAIIQRVKLKAIGDLEKKKYELNGTIESTAKELDQIKEKYKIDTEELNKSYSEKKKIFDEIHTEILLYDMHLKEPPYEGTDDEFKAAIAKIKEHQKSMTSNTIKDWFKGMVGVEEHTYRLAVKAFNFECNTLMNKLTLRNYESTKKRIYKARKNVEFTATDGGFQFSDAYFKSKLLELDFHYSKLYKTNEEKENLKRQREIEREEVKLLKDREKAKKEEERLEKILVQATSKTKSLEGEQLLALQNEIEELKSKLLEAHEKTERAQSMAELTKAGYVYVIRERYTKDWNDKKA
jgi:chromosome segregation ATPase